MMTAMIVHPKTVMMTSAATVTVMMTMTRMILWNVAKRLYLLSIALVSVTLNVSKKNPWFAYNATNGLSSCLACHSCPNANGRNSRCKLRDGTSLLEPYFFYFVTESMYIISAMYWRLVSTRVAFFSGLLVFQPMCAMPKVCAIVISISLK